MLFSCTRVASELSHLDESVLCLPEIIILLHTEVDFGRYQIEVAFAIISQCTCFQVWTVLGKVPILLIERVLNFETRLLNYFDFVLVLLCVLHIDWYKTAIWDCCTSFMPRWHFPHQIECRKQLATMSDKVGTSCRRISSLTLYRSKSNQHHGRMCRIGRCLHKINHSGQFSIRTLMWAKAWEFKSRFWHHSPLHSSRSWSNWSYLSFKFSSNNIRVSPNFYHGNSR